ncbi:YnfA family protein [bacterium]|nr:YnfA family protein [bacterium]
MFWTIILTYFFAAIFEIMGCFAFWAVLRLGKSSWWIFPGLLSLIAFAYLLTKIDTAFAGRAYAAYGGIYIISSVLWLWLIENQTPDLWDCSGALLCLIGALIILLGHR